MIIVRNTQNGKHGVAFKDDKNYKRIFIHYENGDIDNISAELFEVELKFLGWYPLRRAIVEDRLVFDKNLGCFVEVSTEDDYKL